MKWVGLTGAMGSGKSTVAGVLRDMGFTVLDADALARAAVGRGGAAEAAVAAAFPGCLRENGPDVGSVDRRALGQLVFADPAALARLESIVHPVVQAEVARTRATLTGPAAFYDVPLLFEKNMDAQFDAILVVDSGIDLRRERLVARTGLSRAEIDARFAAQLAPEIKRARASAVIHNDAGLDELRAEVARALGRIGQF